MKFSSFADISRDMVIAATAGTVLTLKGGGQDPGTIAALIIVLITAAIGIIRYVIARRKARQVNTVLLEELLNVLETINRDPELLRKLMEAISSRAHTQTESANTDTNED